MEIKIHKAHCHRCGYEWVPRKTKIHVCPFCHSFTWNEKEGEKSSKWGLWEKKGIGK